ncbi:MAG: DUF2087 domain-containing protein [Deltaproteobacteria bacterium]|nr:DUF2087 domain-containing protein [Deltaproteobacteria bacterium]MBW2633751.1 DUF2087 domain-containing protein [Deltaproteobacteria bacterium]MBW2678950.1 DUF2087 domain-containing protein [Deltaproteobacteria bacterium]
MTQAFDDCCTIHRYFVDEKVMDRKDSIYWLRKTIPKGKPLELRKSFFDSINSNDSPN